MADPVSLIVAASAISAATAVGGAAIGAVNSRNEAKSIEANARFQHERAREDAQLATEIGDRNAASAIERSRAEARRRARSNERELSATRNAFGATGFTLAGSPLDVLADQAQELEEDEQLIRYQGRVLAQEERFQAAQRRRGILIQDANAQQRADLAINAARERFSQSIIGGFSGVARAGAQGAAPFIG